MTIPQAFQIAAQHHQGGRFADAEGLYRQILAAQPAHDGALHLLGVLFCQTGRPDLATEWIRRAIAANPKVAEYHLNLGNALAAQGHVDEAIVSFRRALELKPDFAEACNNLGAMLRDQGELDEVIALYRRALQLRPDAPETHTNLGNVLSELGRFDEAVVAHRRALELKGEFPAAQNNLGNALRGQGRLDDAIDAYRRAVQLKSDYPDAHNNLGNALRDQGRLDEAVASCRRAIQLKQDFAEAHNNLGNAFRDQGRIVEAIASFRMAIQVKPAFPEALNNLGNALRDSGQLDEAIASFRQALESKPGYPEALNNLGNAFRDRGQLEDAVASFRHALRSQPDNPGIHSNLIHTLHFLPDDGDGMIAGERQRWNRKFGEPAKRFSLPHDNDQSPERPLRIGYVSPDFWNHVVGRNLAPLFEHHDRRNFEILCYSGVVRPDALSEEFRLRAGLWRNTVGVGDEAMTEMIRRDGVDILVDLTQHMAGNRLPVFARKPAPVQVSFAGYPESTGVEAIEHRITDRYLEGDSPTEHMYTMESFWCYKPSGADAQVSPLPALKDGRVTFGCLNSFCKVNERTLRIWARVLGKVKDSRLVMLSPKGSHRQRVLQILECGGVGESRVEFRESRPHTEYLELYHRLDMILDTFPYNGHTTSLDALWMGVPVVSLAGAAPVSRAGFSQLKNLGISELVAYSEDEYVGMAVALADDLPRLEKLRSTLRERMRRSVLMDAPHFARQVEEAYREMWRTWCREQRTLREGL